MKTQNQKLKKITSSPFLEALALISLREIYLFLRNFYGLVFHPFKTTAGILQKPDWSQTFLVFGLPGYLWCFALLFLGLGFWVIREIGVIGEIGRVKLPILLAFAAFSIFIFSLTCYLLYWGGRYLWQCKLRQKNF